MLKSILIQIDDDLIQDCIGCYRSSKAAHFDRGLELPASFEAVMKISKNGRILLRNSIGSLRNINLKLLIES
jgi:hypothetical protein